MWGAIKGVFAWLGHHEDVEQANKQQRYLATVKLLIQSWATRFVVVVVFLPWIVSFTCIMFGWEDKAMRVDEALQAVKTWPKEYVEWLDWTVKACLGIIGTSHIGSHVLSGINSIGQQARNYKDMSVDKMRDEAT